MDNQDKPRLARELAACGELYSKEITKALFEMYFSDLEAFPIEQVVHAISAHRRDPSRGQFFPKPADLIDKLNGSANERAMAAWPEVLRLASNCRNAVSSDPITQKVIEDMGGWRRFGMSDAKELGWMQREFLERYASFTRHDGNLALSAPAGNSRRLGQLVSISAFGDRKETP